MKVEKKIDKLLDQYSRKIMTKKIDLKSILIDFTTDYNKIWRDEK